MNNPPLIGVTTLHRDYKDERKAYVAVRHSYLDAVAAAGGLPVLLPLKQEAAQRRALYERLDGLLLTGGGDMDPTLFGKPMSDVVKEVDAVRDHMELDLARWAMDEGKPLLAICRGLQVLNVAQGGSLVLDLNSERPSDYRHNNYPDIPFDLLAHPVDVAPDSRLATIVADTRFEVNSLHHQAVDTLGDRLRITACAPDGVVEGLETTDDAHPFAVAVQWHPEWLPEKPQTQRLFKAFVEATGSD